MKLYITPFFRGEDEGDGGVRRAVDLQRAWLPRFGVEVVDEPEQADMLLAHITAAPAMLKQFVGKPVIVDCHGLYWAEYVDDDGQSLWQNWALKANADILQIVRAADAVVAHSEWVAQAIRRNTLREVEVLPHGIDLDEWTPPAAHDDYILWNKTRPDPVCDPAPVLELARLLPDSSFVTTFLPDDAPTLPNVQVTGRVPYQDAKRYVEQAGIYLCTTRETFGVGTLEALACGVPVVGWSWGGQREFLIHERDAWLCAPGDVSGLAEGVRWAQEHRAEVVAAGLETVSRFSAPAMMKQYAALLKNVAKRYRKARRAPRTSVIVTAYNLERYLPDCLDSVLAQTDLDLECIVVDDASPDRCGEIADVYAQHNSNVHVVHNEQNVYLSEARNIGIRVAKGRYILPLDADDLLPPNAVQGLADALDADRTLHIAYGNVKFVNEDGETPTDYGRAPGRSGWPMPYRYDWHEQQRNLLPYASMYRREVWERTGGYRRRFRTAEDADFWLRAASYGFRPAMATEADTLIYRNREESMSRVETLIPWGPWYPWTLRPLLRPAGACAEAAQIAVPSHDPPRIAVVIPVGPKHRLHVQDALDSVDAQTFRRFECIVINDSGARLDGLPSWVRLVETSGSLGVAAARNLGVATAQAKLFVPLDADDYLQPEALALYDAAYQQSGPQTVVYSAWYDAKSPDDHEVFMPERFDPDALMQHLRSKGCLHAVTALYETSVWQEVGGFDETLPAWEDWDFQLALYERGVCSVLVPQPLFVYRKHTGMRRHENYVSYEQSKQGILSKWRRYFEGGETLAACGSCSGRRTQQAAAPAGPNGVAASAAVNGQTAELIEYFGGIGNRRFRGPSGQVYVFGGGRNRIKYVLTGDLDFFLSHISFRRLPEGIALPQEPQLVAP